jgi:hypothetical protein
MGIMTYDSKLREVSPKKAGRTKEKRPVLLSPHRLRGMCIVMWVVEGGWAAGNSPTRFVTKTAYMVASGAPKPGLFRIKSCMSFAG